MDEKRDKIIEQIMKELHKSTLSIPVLQGYELVDNTDAIFVAKSKDNSVEQYLEDGKLLDAETFDDRIQKVINETKSAMKNSGLKDTKIIYLGNVNTDLFDFKIYVQDNILGDKQIRQLNAYFVEPESNYFYQISLAAPPMYTKDINYNVVKNIFSRLRLILNNIKYNEEAPIK